MAAYGREVKRYGDAPGRRNMKVFAVKIGSVVTILGKFVYSKAVLKMTGSHIYYVKSVVKLINCPR